MAPKGVIATQCAGAALTTIYEFLVYCQDIQRIKMGRNRCDRQQTSEFPPIGKPKGQGEVRVYALWVGATDRSGNSSPNASCRSGSQILPDL